MSMGAMSDSSARLRKEKHSMSSMCTSSTNSTPGTISAFPSSLHSVTLELICSRISLLISPVSPEVDRGGEGERGGRGEGKEEGIEGGEGEKGEGVREEKGKGKREERRSTAPIPNPSL